jgi:hypothetical protein
MIDPGEERSQEPDGDETTTEDAAFVAQLAANYSPAPLSEARRRELDRSLVARIRTPHRSWRPLTTLAATAAAAAAAVFVLPALFAGNGQDDPRDRGAEAYAAAEWESQLFEATSFLEADEFDDADDLPDDYAAIAGLLLDG